MAALLTIFPLLGNLEMLHSPKVWILFTLGTLGAILQPDYSLKKDRANNKDAGTESLIIWSVFFTQLLAILEAAYLRYPQSIAWHPVTVVILIIMLIGFVLRGWAIYTLGSFFTMHLDIQAGHRVIRSGPYKFFRHPSYVGAFLTYMGTTIFLHSWLSAGVAAILLTYAWIKRILHEEKMLHDTFGKEYEEYCKDVKRCIPGVW